jgi:hypothetical protein
MFFSSFGTDDENELPSSTDWFNHDGEVGLDRTNKGRFRGHSISRFRGHYTYFSDLPDNPSRRP